MTTLDLQGQWRLLQKGSRRVRTGTVPGCVHADLLAAGEIPDPYCRDNERAVQWIGQTEWTYERAFDVPAALLRHARVLLRCEGLDTLATITLNGRAIGTTDNMFRCWEFDAKKFLRPGANVIAVTFKETFSYLAAYQRRAAAMGRPMHAWAHIDIETKLPRGVLRKMPCNFGWDWGPVLVTCGIWQPIRIIAFDPARLADVRVEQQHHRGTVRLTVAAEVERTRPAPLTVAVELWHQGRCVAQAGASVRGGRAHAELTVAKPQLWWPNGMGAQPLYEVRVCLCDRAGATLDASTKRIGLRTLRLVRAKDRWGESFHFSVNGVAFFAKGANWIPADAIFTRMTAARYQALIRDAVAANFNMLRVWGGGRYEDEAFYNACDEQGICVWQEFMFACQHIPLFDQAFCANVRIEAGQQVRRLRHHACLTLWCGNNEFEMGGVSKDDSAKMLWAQYTPFFDVMLRDIVRQCSPDTDYWPSSPHSPVGDRNDFNNPRCGDTHLWDVWHGRKPFEWYRTCGHRFNSEFGFQSFPEPRTVRAYTRPGDRNITSPVMEHHQRSYMGNTAIMQYMLDWFRMPQGFDNTLWLSQILQGMAIKYAVEHWRRSMPRGMGTLYWQYNDCWPVASWASVDFFGRWKALHHMARKFFAPLLVSGIEDATAGTVEIHVTSDLLQPVATQVSWRVTTTAGARLASGTLKHTARPRKNARVVTLKLADLIAKHGRNGIMVWLALETRAGVVSNNFVTFARPKQFDLSDPGFGTAVAPDHAGGFIVTVRAARPALWAWLELARCDARCSDNFFHVRPGTPARIVVTPAQPLTLAAFKKQLRVKSLVDTWHA